jgi:hypothetical protein
LWLIIIRWFFFIVLVVGANRNCRPGVGTMRAGRDTIIIYDCKHMQQADTMEEIHYCLPATLHQTLPDWMCLDHFPGIPYFQ